MMGVVMIEVVMIEVVMMKVVMMEVVFMEVLQTRSQGSLLPATGRREPWERGSKC